MTLTSKRRRAACTDIALVGRSGRWYASGMLGGSCVPTNGQLRIKTLAIRSN